MEFRITYKYKYILLKQIGNGSKETYLQDPS